MSTKKKVVTVVLVVVIAALILGTVYLMQYMPKFRDATPEEMAQYAVYKVDWKSLEGAEGKSEIDIILSMCTEIDPGSAQAASEEETTEAETVTRYFTSETLGQYLHLYKSDLAVTLTDGVLSVGYMEESGLSIVLGYDEDGFYALGVYNEAENFAYFEQEGTASVATNVNGSFGS